MARNRTVSQNTVIILCWLVYCIAYLGRYSYNSNITLIIEDFNVSNAAAGAVGTAFFFAYAIGQVIHGIMSRRYNKRWIFPIALFGSSVINLAVFLGIPFYTFKYLWFLNGLLQSCLWPSLIAVLSMTLDKKSMNKAVILMSTTTCVGTVLSYGSSSLIVWLGNYRFAFVIGAVLMSAIGFIWLITYNAEERYVPVKEAKTESGGRKTAIAGGLLITIMIMAVFAVSDNFVKDGLTTWAPVIFKSRYGLGDETSILLSLVLPVIGVLGAVLSVFLNKYIKDFISLCGIMFAVSAVFLVFVCMVAGVGLLMAVICFAVAVLMMHGINNVLTSIAPLRMRDKIDSGRLAGILNGFCYVGSTLSAYGLGKVADISGWNTVFMLLLTMCVSAVIICVIYISVRAKKADG